MLQRFSVLNTVENGRLVELVADLIIEVKGLSRRMEEGFTIVGTGIDRLAEAVDTLRAESRADSRRLEVVQEEQSSLIKEQGKILREHTQLLRELLANSQRLEHIEARLLALEHR